MPILTVFLIKTTWSMGAIELPLPLCACLDAIFFFRTFFIYLGCLTRFFLIKTCFGYRYHNVNVICLWIYVLQTICLTFNNLSMAFYDPMPTWFINFWSSEGIEHVLFCLHIMEESPKFRRNQLWQIHVSLIFYGLDSTIIRPLLFNLKMHQCPLWVTI